MTEVQKISGSTTQGRNSNLELLRIILMLLIVAHHFVVNSGITEVYDLKGSPVNTLFLELWGMWGKTAINVFVLISGYFMCTSKLTWKRFLKIVMEVKFYHIVMFSILLVMGYEIFSFKRLFIIIFKNLNGVESGFTPSFLAFYLFIPFYNIVVEKLEKKKLLQLIGLLLLLFTVTATFFFNHNVFHHVGWYMTLYFIAAYIRLYPAWWMKSSRFTGIGLIVSVLLGYLSVLGIELFNYIFNKGFRSYYFVADSNKILALVISVFAFLWFNNLKIQQSKFINGIASTTFGVLLIHANSDAMRTFLWNDLLNVPGMFEYSIWKLVLCAVLSAVGIFAVCSAIDYIRICVIEKPLFRWIGKNEDKITSVCKMLIDKISHFIKIIENKLKKYCC